MERRRRVEKYTCADGLQAHIKSALVGASVMIPIKDGKLATGTWQGIWYLEFRASKHQRKVVATIQGEKM
jgi:secondary thiamine-phosphate synthase enzyme